MAMKQSYKDHSLHESRSEKLYLSLVYIQI